MSSFKKEIVAKPDQATARFYAWLDTQKPKPPDEKEKKRMKEAIEFDLQHRRVYLGITVEERMKTFRSLGYLYDERDN